MHRFAHAARHGAWLAATALLVGCGGRTAHVLDLPPRQPDAPGWSALASEIRALDPASREERIHAEIARGNVPGWLRRLRPVQVEADVEGRRRRATFWVTPDYLAVGGDDDFLRVPLSPGTAQRLADLVGGALPTTLLVDAVWSAAEVRLEPAPIPPSPKMTTVPVFEEHDRMVTALRALREEPPGALVAGHKKDVVVTDGLASAPGRVAIYGWHRPDGRPIQPLYLGHTDAWVDYSHGIRIVHRQVLVDGAWHDLYEALADPATARLFNAEGVVAQPRYPTDRDAGDGTSALGGADGDDGLVSAPARSHRATHHAATNTATPAAMRAPPTR